MIYKNPEFRKNIKLEFSVTRLLIPAFILALAAWIGWNMGEVKSWETMPLTHAKAQSLTYWMFGFGFIFSIIWGSYLAANSLFAEMRQKTWDFMRMSSISPQKILFGKLFGSTSVVWVITLLGVIPVILMTSSYLFVGGGYHRPLLITLASLTGAIVFWMILSYSFVMLAGAYTYSRDSRHTTIGAVLVVLVAGLFIGGVISTNYSFEFRIYEACRHLIPSVDGAEIAACFEKNPIQINGRHYSTSFIETVSWYNFHLFPLDVMTFLIIFAACWTVIGLYRTLRSGLQYMDSPYIWPVFLMMTAFFLNGFYFNDRVNDGYRIIFAILLAFAIFPVCIKEARNQIGYRQLYESVKAKKYKESFRLMPLWAISLLCFILIAPVLFLCTGYFSNLSQPRFPNQDSLIPTAPLSLFYASLILFAVRDIIAIHVISWRKSVRLPTIGIIVYLLLIYALAPFMAKVLFSSTSNGDLYFIPLIVSKGVGLPDPMIFISIHTAIILALLIPFRKGLKNILRGQ